MKLKSHQLAEAVAAYLVFYNECNIGKFLVLGSNLSVFLRENLIHGPSLCSMNAEMLGNLVHKIVHFFNTVRGVGKQFAFELYLNTFVDKLIVEE